MARTVHVLLHEDKGALARTVPVGTGQQFLVLERQRESSEIEHFGFQMLLIPYSNLRSVE